MKRVAGLLLGLQVLSFVPTASVAQEPPIFSDIEYSWYQPIIEELAQKKAITGYDDGTFKPTEVINRAEFLTLLMRSQSSAEPVVGGRRCFPDVNPDVWYASWVCTASRRQIVGGYPDGNFRGEQIVNIAEAHAMLLRLLDADIQEQPGEKWYEPYSEFLHEQEIISKFSYIPWNPLTRERAADLVHKLSRYKDSQGSSRDSPGCGKPEPGTEPTKMTVHGEQRDFLLTVPRNYENRKRIPLIIAFHGRTNSAEQVRSYYGLDRTMDDYIIAYPQARQNGNGNGFTYNHSTDLPQKWRDISFFDELTHTLANQYCIDMYQIYVVGHSLGGWFANTIACARGDIVRASASVGSSTTITECDGPAAGIFIHNPKDNLAPISTGKVARDQRMETNMCDSVWQKTSPDALSCEQVSCLDGQPVVWCPHTIDTDHRGAFYPHVWPEGAEQAIKSFFEGLPD